MSATLSKQKEIARAASFQKGKPPAKQPYFGSDAENYLTPEYLRGGLISDPIKASLTAVRVNGGETIILWDGSNAGEVFRAKKGVLSSTMMRLKHVDDFDDDYFYYALKKWEPFLKGQTSGSGIPHVDKEVLGKLKIHEFEKPEQTKIAEILSTVDRAIEQTEALIAKQQRIKTGLMQDLLTRGIDEKGDLRSEQTHKFKDSPLGRIPAEWEVKQIKDLGLVVTGNTPSESAFDDEYQSVPFVTPADVGGTTAINRTTRSFGKTSAASVRMIPAGSICVVCIGSTIGKIGVTVCKVATNQQINSLIPHEPQISEYLLHSMLLNLPHQLRKEAGLQAVPIVNKSTFERLFIAKPRDSNEVIEIQRQISSPAATAESSTLTLAKLRLLKTGLMQDLLTGSKRVTSLIKETNP